MNSPLEETGLKFKEIWSFSAAKQLLDSIQQLIDAEAAVKAQGNSGEFYNCIEKAALQKRATLLRRRFVAEFQNKTGWTPQIDNDSKWSLILLRPNG